MSATRQVVIEHASGLHARPAVKLAKLAKSFTSKVMIGRVDGPPADAKSLIRVMGLKVKAGETLAIGAEGPDEAEAVAALEALIAGDFEE